MKGKIIQFSMGRHTIHERHFLVEIPGITKKAEAEKLIGKEVQWTSPGKREKIISGKISSAHGNKGVVRAIFERGLPGQALTTEVSILASENEKTKSEAGREVEIN
ncbi:50S ribosomal protein L35ae [Candidatus Pacearchaeota archaeon]|nr:50S ribosomal protein L35ae [Candidatus Pacearchaeota archaeon]